MRLKTVLNRLNAKISGPWKLEKGIRVLSFKEQYTDGTINVRDGSVELWHAIEPLWQLDYITDAQFNPRKPLIHINGYTNQTVTFRPSGMRKQVPLPCRMYHESLVYSQSDSSFHMGTMPWRLHCESLAQSRSVERLDGDFNDNANFPISVDNSLSMPTNDGVGRLEAETPQ